MPELPISEGRRGIGTYEGKVGGPPGIEAFTIGTLGGGNIFSNLSTGGHPGGGTGGAGIIVEYTSGALRLGYALPDLQPFAAIPGDYLAQPGGGGSRQVLATTGQSDILRTILRSQLAVGYMIDGIGFVRAQVIGPNGTAPGGFTLDPAGTGRVIAAPAYLGAGDIKSPRFEFAFQLNQLVTGLNLDIGAKYYLPQTPGMVKTFYTRVYDKDDEVVDFYGWAGYNPEVTGEDWVLNAPIFVGLGATYALQGMPFPVTIAGRVDAKLGGSFEVIESATKTGVYAEGNTINYPTEIYVHLWPSIRLPDMGNITVGLNVGFNYYGATTVSVDGDDPIAWGDKEADTPSPFTAPGTRAPGGFIGGSRFSLGVRVDVPMPVGTLTTGLAFRNGAEINGLKEDMVITLPVIWGMTF